MGTSPFRQNRGTIHMTFLTNCISSSSSSDAPLSLEEPEINLALWTTPDGEKCSQSHVFDWVSKTKLDLENEHQVIVGTDSHMHGQHFRFISVVCVYKVGKGGYYYYLESYEPRDNYVQKGLRGKKVKGNQKLRMFNEVARSCDVATSLWEETGVLPIVHIDASPSHKKEFTSEFSDQLKGYVDAHGFQCALKPVSWAASVVADRYTK